MPDEADIAGYTPKTIQKLLSTFKSHPTNWNWRHSQIFGEILGEVECYICETSWTSKAQVKYLAGDVIPPVKQRV